MDAHHKYGYKLIKLETNDDAKFLGYARQI